jgi:arylsulfatase A-like enzyme
MWGGGIRGGAVIGKTDKEGASVVERPTTAQDFLATVCDLLGIDYTKKNETANGRPVQIVEKAKPFTDEII